MESAESPTLDPDGCGGGMGRSKEYEDLYRNRPLVEGYPALDELERRQVLGRAHHSETDCAWTVTYLTRLLVEPVNGGSALVVGCGSRPEILLALHRSGFHAVGIEPVPSLAAEARTFLEGRGSVAEGSAESLPVDDASQRLVLLESVLEHVDSPEKALAEAYRVLGAGGIAYITTTNRLQLRNSEYRMRFFQWLPPVLKEAYIHQHLHFNPSLGNFTTRPAVHWFSYSDLCKLGRSAGFYRFYSKVDVVRRDDPPIACSALRRFALRWAQTRPLVRALALTQNAGGTVYMVKR